MGEHSCQYYENLPANWGFKEPFANRFELVSTFL